jgi:hypothetical protein
LHTFTRVIFLAALASLLALSLEGCHRGGGYEHGDRIDDHGHRDVGWCDQHHDDEHCH